MYMYIYIPIHIHVPIYKQGWSLVGPSADHRGGSGSLHEYVERRTKYGIPFTCSLFCEHIHLEYVRMHAICRVNLAEYGILIPMAAP